MPNNQTQKNIPNSWQELKLEKVLKVGSGKDYKHLNNGKIPVFGTGGYMLSVDDFLYSGETVFIGRKGTIDKPFYYKGKFWTVDTLFYTYDYKNTNAKYINFIFQKINWKSYNEASGVPSLSKATIEKIKFVFPPLPEQKRIVKVLETWDMAIEKLERKNEIKKNIKKGLMQRLLTGKVRLPGFGGEWKKRRLKDVVEFFNGKAHEKSIVKNGKYIVVNSKFVSTDGKVKKYSNESHLSLIKNDIVMVMSDVPNGKAIAKCFFINESNKYTLNQRICLLRSRKDNSKFLYYIINRNRYFLQFDDGVGQTNLRKDEVVNCPLFLPPLSEQNAIVNIIGNADNEIKLLEDKLDKLKEQKKYLLNNLVTGKIRMP